MKGFHNLSGSKALDIIKQNWSALSGFTNNEGEKITVQQIEDICNRKAASKCLELLLKNASLKNLAMNTIVYILMDDRRTHKFIKNFSH